MSNQNKPGPKKKTCENGKCNCPPGYELMNEPFEIKKGKNKGFVKTRSFCSKIHIPKDPELAKLKIENDKLIERNQRIGDEYSETLTNINLIESKFKNHPGQKSKFKSWKEQLNKNKEKRNNLEKEIKENYDKRKSNPYNRLSGESRTQYKKRISEFERNFKKSKK